MDPYNVFCTKWGCFAGVRRDDVDNGWPAWPAWPDAPCFASGPIGAPSVGCDGVLRAPPRWHYTVPQDQGALMATCGPAGCGPVLLPVRSAWSSSPVYGLDS